ncbi:O-antigen ligase family protein [Ruminiclostridium josui]|uniref:O-antigen ligase family protein n=1 Tax=Ruminiclostridium josui TaxID=1499 RepID=UPI0004640EFD|nr:O-antigen ligase family protein [Ruminiclostridium josui]
MNKKTAVILLILGLLAGVCGAFAPTFLLVAFIAGVIFTAAMMFDYSKFLYVLGFYVLIDYVLRYVISSALLASFWDELLFVFALCLWLYKWVVYRKLDGYVATPLDIPLVFFVVISICLLLVNAPIMAIGIAGFRQVVQQMLWYFVVAQLVTSSKNIRWFLYIMVFIGGVLGLHGIYQYITHAEMPSYWVDRLESGIKTRVFSIIGSPNILGSLMVLLIPVAISFVFSERKIFKKILFAGITLAMTATLIFTSSRSAWIGFVVAMGVYFWLKDKRLILLLVLMVAAAYFAVPTIAHRVNYLLSPQYMISSAAGGRIARWTIGIAALKQHPWFGLGLGQFGGAVAQNFKIPGAFYVDSYFLKIAVEMGLVGLTSFCILIYNTLAWGIRAVKRTVDRQSLSMAQGVFAGMVGVVVPNFVENVFEVPMMTAYFWMFAAVLIALGFTIPNQGLKRLNVGSIR